MNDKEKFADEWRKKYDQLSCSNQIKELSYFQDEYIPEKETTANFRRDIVIKFFDYILSKKEKIRVLEFGGGIGHLANYIIDRYDERIKEWLNYEMQTFSITENQCIYPQYIGIISTKFLWEYPPLGNWDIFISTHAIEHIKAYQVKQLFDRIRDKISFIYLESPIRDDTGELTQEEINSLWDKCSACHVLEIGWKQILDMLPEFKNLEEFTVPYIIWSYPPFPSYSNKFPVPEVDKSIKTIWLKGKKVNFAIQLNQWFELPGHRKINYDDPRNNGGVRCLEKIIK